MDCEFSFNQLTIVLLLLRPVSCLPNGQSLDLIIVCAFYAASDFLDDRPTVHSFWNGMVLGLGTSNLMVHNTKLELLKAIDWRIHSLSSPERVGRTLAVLYD